MTAHTASGITPAPILQARYNLIIHQALHAAAKLGVADLLERGPRTTAELATELKVNEEALYRTLRALAGQKVFEEAGLRTFRNSPLSCFLRTGYPGSVRSFLIYWGTEFYYRSLGEILTASRLGSQPEPNSWA
jgi:hypothetical protein